MKYYYIVILSRFESAGAQPHLYKINFTEYKALMNAEILF